MSIVMYGMPPEDAQRRWPEQQPQPQPIPTWPLQPAPFPMPEQSTASTVDLVRRRVEWLRRELAQHEAWKQELAILERMLAAADESPK